MGWYQNISNVRASTTSWYKISHCPLNPYLCTHQLVQLLDHIKEVSLCSGWWLKQKLTTEPSTECLWSARSYIGHLYCTPFPQCTTEGEVVERFIRARGQDRGGRCQRDEKQVPSGHDRPCTHEHTVTMIACSRPAKIKPVTMPACTGEVFVPNQPGCGAFHHGWLIVEGNPVFFKVGVPGRLTMCQLTAPCPWPYGLHKLNLAGCNFLRHKIGGLDLNGSGRSWGEVGVVWSNIL